MFPLSFSRSIAAGAMLSATTLTAQAPVVPLTPDTVPLPRPAAAPATQKSVGGAVMISVASTFGPAVLALETHNTGAVFASSLGVLIGPSTGYWYAGSPKWKGGLITRGVAAGIGAGGVLLASRCPMLGPDSGGAGCGLGAALAIGGAAVIVISDIIDIAKLPQAVRAERVPAFTVAPVIGAGARSAGLSMQLRF
jgi:hypothetical protein